MIIHSIVSESDIFCNMGDEYGKVEYKAIKGGILELSDTGGGKCVRRLISTDPSLYLKSEYSPYSAYNG